MNRFEPKYISRYNKIQSYSTQTDKRIFTPKDVKVYKREELQESYVKRRERENLREYNG